MKFASSYEPGNYESDIYAAWEAYGVFNPPISKYPVDDNGDGVDDRIEYAVSKDSRSRASGAWQGEDKRRSPVATGRPDAAREGLLSIRPSCTYSIVMPPPNANGNLHIGHGLTVALEDSLIRYHRLQGDSAWYIPGADHAGFETWVVYEKTLEKAGHTRFEYDRDELYSRVWNFVAEQRGNMELQLRALGASCAWDDLTFTLDENVIDRVYTTFEKMWNDGLIYRGEKLVNFCPKHQTAFADIEVEHKDEKGTLWEIEYPIAGTSGQEQGPSRPLAPAPWDANGRRPTSEEPENAHSRGSGAWQGEDERRSPMAMGRPDAPREGAFLAPTESIVVSTTRPETLFGDVAVAVNPNDARYQNLIGKTVRLPLTNREIPIIADEHADPEYGSGAVKITPAHDFDDFEVGERHNLERIQVIAENGTMINVPEEYDGLTTAECRKKVLKALKAGGYLKGEKPIVHSVAHCYKCGTVLEPMLKEQWFIDVKKLARVAIEHLENNEIKFHPENKQKVLINYLEGLKDWNISRQIPWGIAIPMFRKITPEATDEPDWIFDRRTNLKEIEKAGVKYIRDEDTFDTWFSSSHWPIVCTNWTEDNYNPYYPLNVMETGADILFAWVARMIMMGLYVTGEVPFKDVYLHGLVLDEHGKKMSKSKGNVINPMELVTKYGSDAFRIGILRGRSAGMNQAFSENSVISGRNLCNKLWNISRLVQSIVDEAADGPAPASCSAVSDTKVSGDGSVEGAFGGCCRERSSALPVKTGERDCVPETEPIPETYSTLNMGEDWICRELNNCLAQVEQNMQNYRFSEAVEVLYQTIWDKYADWFLESQKLYKNTELLKTTLETLLIALHPFAPFVTEAIWQTLSWTDGFIATAKWPARLAYDPISAENFENIRTIVSEVRGTLQALPGVNNAKKYGLLYDNDSLIADNVLLIKHLAKVPSVSSLNGAPRGLRLAIANHEVFLDVPEKVVTDYRDALEARILSVGREIDALNLRLSNPNYVAKAPAHLVKETQDAIQEKTALIARLKQEFSLIK